TVLNTDRALHAQQPPQRNVILALVDKRSPAEERGRAAAAPPPARSLWAPPRPDSSAPRGR
ncbi:hypothetical protein ACFV00_06085, partial [Streptomyces californicus]|uniref:hypothetical protein n=1 Tax=Streptomyces californicus TaxID=67351 RepID=UPI0036CFE0F7